LTLFLLWPLWVSVSLLATGNHFWIDFAAGCVLASIGVLVAATPFGAGLARTARRAFAGACGLETERARDGARSGPCAA